MRLFVYHFSDYFAASFNALKRLHCRSSRKKDLKISEAQHWELDNYGKTDP